MGPIGDRSSVVRILRSALARLFPQRDADRPELEILCLANSRKLSGRCVAGLRTDGSGWVRPVTDPQFGGTLATADTVLADGREAALFDVLRLTLTEPCPAPHQPENWLVAPVRWRLMERMTPQAAEPLLLKSLVSGPDLLGSRGDRVAYSALEEREAAASLVLIEPEALDWRIVTTFRGSRQTRARFTVAGAAYDLSVTDPVIEHRLSTLSPGVYPRAAAGIDGDARVLLTVSLGEPFYRTGDCFKLVAAAIVLPATATISATEAGPRETDLSQPPQRPPAGIAAPAT